MDYVSHKLDTWELESIKVNDSSTISICFFANDLGIFISANERNFLKIREILYLYEDAAGAKMNLLKTVIIPLALPMIPQWVTDSG